MKVSLDGAFRHAAHVDHEDMVEIVRHGREIVVDGDHRFAFGLQGFQDVDDGAFGGGVDACEGFIEQIEIGVLGQSAGEEDALLLAA